MFKKIRRHKMAIAMLTISFAFAAGAITVTDQQFSSYAASTTKTIELTLEALKAYNGTKGKPIYVAYKGIIYDVSKVDAFKKNTYKSLVPGTDITKALAKIKNGENLLKAASKVGKIVAAKPAATNVTATKPSTTSATTSTVSPSSSKDEAKKATDASSSATKQLELTLEELKVYDGKEGRRAYVAIDGIIYDVTDVPAWKNGIHQGLYKAGQDLSEIIKKSPHGKAALEKALVVGKLKTE